MARSAYEAGDLILARERLRDLDPDDPDVQALQLSIDAGFHEWEKMKPSLRRLNQSSTEQRDWAVTNIFNEVSGLLDRRFYEHANEAVSVLPNSSQLNRDQTFTLARVYYEVGDKDKALELIEKLDLSEPEHVCLYAALHIGLHDWTELAQIFKTRYILHAGSEWVLFRLAGEINRLIDVGDLGNAMRAIQVIPDDYIQSEKLCFAVARGYYESAVLSHYETGFIAIARGFIDKLNHNDTHILALKLAIYSGLGNWVGFKSLTDTVKLSWSDLRWVYLQVLSQMSHLVDRGKFSEAYEAFQLIPKEFPVPARFYFGVARTYFELNRLTEAEALMRQLGGIDGSHNALIMAISASLYKWEELKSALEKDYTDSRSMNWVVGSVFSEVDDLIDRKFPKEALSAVALIPDEIEIPKAFHYSLARVYYENKDFKKAYEIGQKLDLENNKHVGLMIGIALGLKNWTLLRRLFEHHYYPVKEIDWILERLPNDINDFLDKGDIASALEATKILEDNLYPSEKLSYTLGRCYYEAAVLSLYEPSFINRAYIYSETLDHSDFESYSLHLAVLASLADWARFKELLQSQDHSWRKLRWVFHKVLDQITYLVSQSDFELAYEALRCLPFKFPIPGRYQFDVARVYFAADRFSEAEVIVRGLNKEDLEHKALQLAIFVQLDDWENLKTQSASIKPQEHFDWIWGLIFPKIQYHYDNEDYEEVCVILEALPSWVKLTQSLRFPAARSLFEGSRYDAAAQILSTLVKDEPRIIALDMAVKARQRNWGRVSELMSLYFSFDRDMDWVVKEIFDEISNLVEEGDFDGAIQGLSVLPENIFFPPKQRFEIARVYYEGGRYKSALAVLESIPEDSPAKQALAMAIYAELHQWDALEVALKSDFDPSGNMDWVLERVYSAISRSDFAANQQQAKRLEDLIISSHFEQSSVAVKYRILETLTRAGRYDVVIREAGRLREQTPLDIKLLIIMARAAYLRREWGRDIELFEEFLVSVTHQHELYAQISDALHVTNTISMQSELSSEQSQFRVTDHLLDIYFRSPKSRYRPKRKSTVAMVGDTMAAGGAEHVLVNAQIGMLQRDNVHSEMWLHNIDSTLNHDHFLKQYRLNPGSKDAIHLLSEVQEITAPYKWLEGYVGRKSQSVYEQLMQAKPSVVHAWQDSSNIEAALAGILAGVPRIVLHPHNMRPDLVHRTTITKSLRNAYRILLKRKDTHLICCSNASLQDYLTWLDMEKTSNCHVIYNGFNWSNQTLGVRRRFSRRFLHQKLGISPDMKVVGGIFRMDEVKQPMLWAEIARQLIAQRKDIAFVIFGDGPQMPDLQRFIAAHDLSERFHLAGRVENATKHSAACDAILQTSRTEGLPTVLIEAMSNGIPVIASDVGGTRETFAGDNPDMFRLVDGFAPRRFVQAVSDVIDQDFSQANRRDLSKSTRHKFSIDAMVDGLIKVYGFR